MIAILEQGLLLSLAAIGVYISFRVVDLPDLTPDGSYVLGGAVAVSLLYAGHGWVFSTLMAILSGAIAGCVVAFITTRFRDKFSAWLYHGYDWALFDQYPYHGRSESASAEVRYGEYHWIRECDGWHIAR